MNDEGKKGYTKLRFENRILTHLLFPAGLSGQVFRISSTGMPLESESKLIMFHGLICISTIGTVVLYHPRRDTLIILDDMVWLASIYMYNCHTKHYHTGAR